MPRYRYKCNDCEDEFIVAHSWKEIQEKCVLCGETNIQKLLTKPLVAKKRNKTTQVGTTTKKYREDNKEILKNLKEEIQKEEHEQT